MHLFASKTLANALVIITAIYLTIAILWPQAKLLDSPAFIGLGLLFFCNLSACTLKQVMARPKGPRLGLLVLHLGLVAILMGVGFNYLWGGQGFLHLGVEQEKPLVSGMLRNWRGGPLLKQWDSGYSVKLLNVRIEMKAGKTYLRSGTLEYRNSQGQRGQRTVSFVQPLKLAGARLWVNERGFAPVLDWGDELVQWGIQTQRHGDRETYRDQMTKPGYNFQGEFFPGGQDGRQGKLLLKVRGPRDEQTYTLLPGESFMVGGQRVFWQDTSYWMVFTVTIQPGLPLVWIGSILIIAGCTWYYLPLLWKRERDV